MSKIKVKKKIFNNKFVTTIDGEEKVLYLKKAKNKHKTFSYGFVLEENLSKKPPIFEPLTPLLLALLLHRLKGKHFTKSSRILIYRQYIDGEQPKPLYERLTDIALLPHVNLLNDENNSTHVENVIKDIESQLISNNFTEAIYLTPKDQPHPDGKSLIVKSKGVIRLNLFRQVMHDIIKSEYYIEEFDNPIIKCCIRESSANIDIPISSIFFNKNKDIILY